MNVTIPKGLDLTTEILDYNKAHDDKYLWVINSIIFPYLTKQIDQNKLVPLNSQLLKKYLGDRYYKDVIKSLVESDIIKTTKSYKAGEFSKGFRLADRFKDCKFECRKIRKTTYQKKIRAIATDNLKRTLLKRPALQAEFKALTYNRIALKPALKYIQENYKKDSKEYQSRRLAIEKYNLMKDAQFNNGSYSINFAFIYKGGRLYTPASMLPRDLEQFTYFTGYENEDVAVLDMPTSQPKFYDRMINGRYNGNDSDYQKLLFDDNRDLYYTLMADINYKSKASHSSEERREFKPYFYENLFFNKYTPKNKRTKLEKGYALMSPKDAKKLLRLKYSIGNKALAKRVHAIEGKMFHVKIVKFMMKNYKSVPFSIKHDSIKIPVRFVDELKPQLELIVSDYFNRNIKLNLEHK